MKEYLKIITLLDNVTKAPYNRFQTVSIQKSYKSYIETSVRSFIKACYSDDPKGRYGIPLRSFANYDSLIDFINSHEPAREVRINKKRISDLRHRNQISRSVPRIKENILFVKYVKDTFPSFEEDRFFKELSVESIRAKKNK